MSIVYPLKKIVDPKCARAVRGASVLEGELLVHFCFVCGARELR